MWPRKFQKVQAPRLSWHSAHESGKVVSLTHRPPLPPGIFLVLIFTRGWVDPRAMVQSEGNMSLKNPLTPPGIDPGTIRLVVQRLNHYATPGPQIYYVHCTKLVTACYTHPQPVQWHSYFPGILIRHAKSYIFTLLRWETFWLALWLWIMHANYSTKTCSLVVFFLIATWLARPEWRADSLCMLQRNVSETHPASMKGMKATVWDETATIT